MKQRKVIKNMFVIIHLLINSIFTIFAVIVTIQLITIVLTIL